MYKLLVGLGNPGKAYQNSRHNLGSVLVEKYAKLHNIKLLKKPKLNAYIGQNRVDLPAVVGDWNIILALPTTFMNLSGITVKKITNFYKITPENIFIAHDDLDIGVGESKIAFNQSSAGHNGIKSIIENLGTQAFWRLRIGIGHPQDAIPTQDYVLMPPTKKELLQINSVINEMLVKIDTIFTIKPKSS
jgi:PTH1 family peptidyl-tRNA hydrolase